MPSQRIRGATSQHTYRQPRVTLFHVVRRTIMKLVDMQVWDLAASMTFFSLLSVLPAAVSLVSIVSMLGLEDETVYAGAELLHELMPGLDPNVLAGALLALANTGAGVLGVVLGLVGSIISASSALASFYRGMHRIYDTREGRRFLWFRTVIFFETLALMVAVIAVLLLVFIGGDLSARLGNLLGLPATTVATWNVLKWPVILVLLVFTVTLAYHWVPNVVQPYFHWLSWGGMISVLALFAMTLLLGWLADRFGSFDWILGTLNGVIAIALVTWISFIVLMAGAAFDAELLRGRQLADGLPAWDSLQLRTRHTTVLEFLDADVAKAHKTAQAVAESVRTGEPVTLPRGPWIAEADTFWSIDAVDRKVSTGTPYSSGLASSTPGDN